MFFIILKEMAFPMLSYKLIYFIFLILALFLSLMNWLVIPIQESMILFTYSIMLFLVILSMGVYPVLFAGWASNSKYTLIEATRSVAQTTPYNVSMALILSTFLLLQKLKTMLMTTY